MDYLLTHILAAFVILVWNAGIVLFVLMAVRSTHMQDRFVPKRHTSNLKL